MDDSSDDPDDPGKFCEQTGKFIHSKVSQNINCFSNKSTKSLAVTRSKAVDTQLRDSNNKDQEIDNLHQTLPTTNKLKTISYGPIRNDYSKLTNSTSGILHNFI